MGKKGTSPGYMIDITRTDLLSLEELGGGLIPKKNLNEVFLTYEGVIGSY